MAAVDFTKEKIWALVNFSIEPDNTGSVEAKMGIDPVTTRKALLLIDGATPGGASRSTILLISPSLADTTKSKAMKAAMKKETAVAFALSDVSFHSTVLVIGDDFSDMALSTVQNSDTLVKKVTLNTLSSVL